MAWAWMLGSRPSMTKEGMFGMVEAGYRFEKALLSSGGYHSEKSLPSSSSASCFVILGLEPRINAQASGRG